MSCGHCLSGLGALMSGTGCAFHVGQRAATQRFCLVLDEHRAGAIEQASGVCFYSGAF